MTSGQFTRSYIMERLLDVVLSKDIRPHFREHEKIRAEIERACESRKELAAFHVIGSSEEGRELYGVVIGKGDKKVSLIAGAHSDEPVGPETLRYFILEVLRHADRLHELLAQFTFVIVPHINPDGEARNRSWLRNWPDVKDYIRKAYREPPWRDLEFGFPSMRPENRSVSEFLSSYGPYALHMSLHGMGFGEGGMLLIDRYWSFRTQRIRDQFKEGVLAAGLDLHDHNRRGEKGFFYIDPGFSTTPESEAMRIFFLARNDRATASLFHESSMEFVRSLGDDPLCMVTELPLFVIKGPSQTPGLPEHYLRFKDKLPEIRLRLNLGETAEELEAFRPEPVPLDVAIRLHLLALDSGLEHIRAGGNAELNES